MVHVCEICSSTLKNPKQVDEYIIVEGRRILWSGYKGRCPKCGGVRSSRYR